MACLISGWVQEKEKKLKESNRLKNILYNYHILEQTNSPPSSPKPNTSYLRGNLRTIVPSIELQKKWTSATPPLFQKNVKSESFVLVLDLLLLLHASARRSSPRPRRCAFFRRKKHGGLAYVMYGTYFNNVD